jgi:hypothetical protein
VQRLAPLAQRLHTDFATDRRFDNPRAPQVRLAPFDTDLLLTAVGRRVRDLFAEGRPMQERVRAVVGRCLHRGIGQGGDRPPGRPGGRRPHGCS